MTRWSLVASVATLSIILLACLGCENPPDASAESGLTCAYMSERNDAQCAADLEGCSRDCLHGQDKARLAHHEGEGCSKPECTCPDAAEAGCAEAHAGVAGEDGDGSAKSDCTCPHAANEGCAKARAATAGDGISDAYPGCPYARAATAGDDVSEAHPGCPYARAGGPEDGSESH